MGELIPPYQGEERRQDPSANVLQLVGNATIYLEKLNEMGLKYFEQKLDLAVEASRRERAVETARIDACRRDDTEAVKVANQMAVKQAEVLAAQMAENAEALRAGMAKTAETLATQLQQVTKSLDDRLKIVEEKQYIIAGASKGSRDMWGWISAGVVLAISIVGFLLKW